MDRKRRIHELIATSTDVLRDVALENGAIVAANTDKRYYPREASDYRYVWPRDAAFVCVAAKRLHLPIQESFFRWLDDKVEDFRKDRLLYANYATNGRIGSLGRAFEPDQMGTVLWAITEHFGQDQERARAFTSLIQRLADGLCAVWDHRFFIPNTVDLWEDMNRMTTTRMENNFTYSLAAGARGLLQANHILPTALWRETAMEMLREIDEAYDTTDRTFSRNTGKLRDRNVDASLLGLLWPFAVVEPTDERIRNTVEKIEQTIVVNGGVHRFQFDYFDSEGKAWEGGGAWPLLNFWLAIVWHRLGDDQKAHAYYDWVLERVDQFIPEQIFDDFRVGIYPLAWSHAFFILATAELGLLPASR